MWFYKARSQWVEDVRQPETGRKLRWYLGPDERQATVEYHRRMASLYGEQAPVQTADLTLVELAERYLAWCEANCAKSTVHYRACYLAWLLDHEEGGRPLGLSPAPSLRPQSVEAVKAAHRSINAPRSVNAFVATVQALYNWSVDQGLLQVNPVSKVRQVPRAPKQRRSLSAAELSMFLSKADEHPPLGDFARVLVHTAMRRGELDGLPWSAYDPVAKVLILYHHKTVGKTGLPRHVPLCAEAVDAIERQPRRDADSPIFTVGADALYQRLVRLRKAAGLPARVKFHALRHTAITLGKEANIPRHIVQEMAGHGSTLMSEYYTDADLEMMRGVGDAVADALRKAKESPALG